MEPQTAKIDVVADHERSIFEQAQAFFSRPLLKELIIKLLPASGFVAIASIVIPVWYGQRGQLLALSSVLVTVAQCLTAFVMMWQTRISRLYFWSTVLAVVTLVWPVLLLQLSIGPDYLAWLIFILYGFSLCRISWNEASRTSIICFLLSLTILFLFRYPESPIYACLILIVGLVLYRASANQYLSLMLQSQLPLLTAASKSVGAMNILKLLGIQCSLICESATGLIIYEKRGVEVVSLSGIRLSKVDSIFARGIRDYYERTGNARMQIRTSELPGDFRLPLIDWFGFHPRKLYLIEQRAVIDDVEEKVIIVIPETNLSLLLGNKKIEGTLTCFAEIVSMALLSTRSRFVTSDKLLELERKVSDLERESNHLVHQVNNIAQEITISFDSINQVVKDLPFEQSQAIRLPAAKIEGALRALVASMSDVKWMAEILRCEPGERLEAVSVKSVVHELGLFGAYCLERKGGSFQIVDEVEQTLAVLVPSKEFLEAVLRKLINMACSDFGSERIVALRIFACDDQVHFELKDSGKLREHADWDDLIGYRSKTAARRQISRPLVVVAWLAHVSNGVLEQQTCSEGPFLNLIKLSLPAAQVEETKKDVRNSGWALLVDDKDEVRMFYQRVADALELKSKSASSVAEAKQLLADNGKPLFVITDIQLETGGSGLDIVRLIRAKFGSTIPILVVSGESDEGTLKAVRELDLVRYLNKPLSRKRLFDEISTVLKSIS